MPEEAYWSSFFNAECVVRRLLGDEGSVGDVVEFGCGYGTFTLPAADLASGIVHALDIEPDLIEHLRERVRRRRISNIEATVRDFVTDGTGLEGGTQSHAMIYNLLHIEEPEKLIEEARRNLRPGGRLSVIHWRSDIATPRGPSLKTRPTPEQCRAWMEATGFRDIQIVDLSDCCEFHFGMVGAARA